MAGEDDGVRRSRRLQGDAAEIFCTPLLKVRDDAKRMLEQAAAAENDFRPRRNFAETASISSKSSRKSGSKAGSTVSEATRLKMLAEIQSLERIGKAEDDFTLAKVRFEREKLIEEKRLQMEKMVIEEELREEDEDNKSQELEIEPEVPPTDDRENVLKWLQKEENQPVPEVDPTTAITMRIDKLLTRQTVPKELPQFSGDPEEWLMFSQQYHRTTKLCGLSNEENLVRLQKCLKGRAREAVLPILGIPDNVSRVMQTLEMLFGRTDQIIRSMIQKVKMAPPPTRSKPESLIAFSNMVANLVATMKTLNKLGHLSNPELLEHLVMKLSLENQFQWCQVVRELHRDPSLVEFDEWLNTVAMTASLMPTQTNSAEKIPDSKRKDKKPVFVAVGKDERRCFQCSNPGHKLEDCKHFEEADVQSRWKTVKASKLCYFCLSPGHRSGDCKRRKECGIDGCDKFHNKMLHKSYVKAEEAKAEAKCENWVGHVNPAGVKPKVLLRILPVKLSGPKGVMSTYAMLDEGSTLTMIDSIAASDLGLVGPVVPLCLQWTGEQTQAQVESQTLSLQISGVADGSKIFKLYNVRTFRELGLPSQTVDMQQLRLKWPYLQDVPFDSLVNAKPQILIGSDNILVTTPRKLRHGQWGDPIATKTWLGWVVHGNLPKSNYMDTRLNFHVCDANAGDNEIVRLIKASFSTESFGVRATEDSGRSHEDKRALEILQSTTKRVEERFQTGLLWGSPNIILPESRSNAVRRLFCMERKMDRDHVFAKAYCDRINEYLQKGYCRKLSVEEARIRNPRTNYLPHFAVYNVHKAKLRLVFDASAKNHGVSLNDCLLKGPDFLNPLPAVLMRFRKHRIGIVGDIKEMFHQIRIIPEDTDSQRFLWRELERFKEPEEYAMQVMIFGAACSPSSALYVKDVNSREFAEEFPETAESVISNTYIDDYLYGANTEAEAVKRIVETVELFRRGGFTICNWASSSKAVIQTVPLEFRSKNLINLEEKEGLPYERILGMRWDAESDEFTFEINFPKVKQEILAGEKVPTKREMSALISSVYDPLGLIVHFTIKARILFQQVWLGKTEWDESISTEIFQSWKCWLEELKSINQVRVPRCYFTKLNEAEKVSLHIFVDASSSAFAAVAYLVVQASDDVQTAVVAARARVAPLKALSIPRLELQAAVMGSRLALTIKEEMQIRIKVTYFWSDSRTVLSWIRSDSRRFKQFVAHRVGEIQEATAVTEWKWVPTTENVADEATRPNCMSDFSPTCRWYNGPAFLKLPENQWPVEKAEVQASLEEENLRKEHLLIASEATSRYDVPNPVRFSKWMRLIRATAWVKKAFQLWRKVPAVKCELSGAEIKEAECIWLKVVQEMCFQDELQALRKGTPIQQVSRLVRLSPFIDNSGVLRVKGRLELANSMTYDERHPIILDPNHRYTQLVISHLHEQAAHQGVETVLAELRSKFWVLSGRAAVKRAFYMCQQCKLKKAKPNTPEMGCLPIERLLKPECPFSYTGVDFFGPLTISVLRKHVKRYGVLFTCLSTRAIHLEVAADLTTDATINAVRRFIARRTVPTLMWSDNGTNFHGADRELRQAFEQLDQDAITRTFSGKGITWRFNPPSSPHMGGVWERLIKSVKVALRSTLKETAPKEDVLLTLFAETEYIVNSRPLTHVSVDPEDPQAITPNHFLRLGKIFGNVPGKFGDGNWNHRSQWKLVQEYAEKLWSRWVKEYLPTLTRRVKWCQPAKPLEVGDVVVIADSTSPRNSWPLGRIVKVYPGRDGQVRVAEVKTKDGIYKRPATKICVLDVKRSDEEQLLLSGGRNVEATAGVMRMDESESGVEQVHLLRAGAQ